MRIMERYQYWTIPMFTALAAMGGGSASKRPASTFEDVDAGSGGHVQLRRELEKGEWRWVQTVQDNHGDQFAVFERRKP